MKRQERLVSGGMVINFQSFFAPCPMCKNNVGLSNWARLERASCGSLRAVSVRFKMSTTALPNGNSKLIRFEWVVDPILEEGITNWKRRVICVILHSVSFIEVINDVILRHFFPFRSLISVGLDQHIDQHIIDASRNFHPLDWWRVETGEFYETHYASREHIIIIIEPPNILIIYFTVSSHEIEPPPCNLVRSGSSVCGSLSINFQLVHW